MNMGKTKNDIKKVEKFSLYLYLKHNVNSNLRIQKILFFLRVYEKKNNIVTSPIFDKENENFQAWVYGPVNIDSYNFMRKKLIKEEEIEVDSLNDDDTKLFEKYDEVIDKLNKCESNQLVDWSHQNLEYINVRKRGGIKDWQPCCLFLNESTTDFVSFSEIASEEIMEFLQF